MGRRSWFIDYLTGWTAQLDEIGGGTGGIVLRVTNDYGRSWVAVRDTIDDAFALCYQITQEKDNPHERLLADVLIPPMLNYEKDYNHG